MASSTSPPSPPLHRARTMQTGIRRRIRQAQDILEAGKIAWAKAKLEGVEDFLSPGLCIDLIPRADGTPIGIRDKNGIGTRILAGMRRLLADRDFLIGRRA